MRARLMPAALLVLALLAAGCGSDTHRRDEIAAYFTAINEVQQQLARPLVEVSQANRAFALGKADPAKTRARLERSERTFVRLHRKLAAVDVPPDGTKLQRLLLELVDRQQALAHETLQLADFLPRFAAALQPVGPAGKALRTALNGKQPVATKATALEAYAHELDAVLARVRPLDPPPSSRATWQVQVQTLASVRASVLALAQGLREKSTRIPQLLHRFDAAAASSRSLSAQRAQIAAVQAYNRRVRGLDRVSRQIALERVRLQKLAR